VTSGIGLGVFGAWDACGAGACPVVLFTVEAAGDGACVLAVVVTDWVDWMVFLVFITWVSPSLVG